MHSLYYFLINPEETDIFDPSSPPSPSDFEDWFSSDYIQHYGDENNWFQGELLIYSTGDIHQLCEKDDWRGRDLLFPHYEKIEKAIRWKTALNGCAQALAYDFHLGGHPGISIPGTDSDDMIDKITYPDILSILDTFICGRMEDVKEWFTHKSSIFDPVSGIDTLKNSDYAISKLLICTAHFINSYRDDKRFHIFSHMHDPYDDYRCMQVGDAGYIPKEEKKAPVLCLAMVDIHT